MTIINARRLAPAWPVASTAMLGATLAFASPAHAGIYVDNALGAVAPTDMVHVAAPRPAQLLFEFDTGGRINARGSKIAMPIVKDQLQKLGIVGPMSDTPVPDGARLVITIDDIGDKDAAGKGAAVGLTLGLVGKVVADNYTFVIRYTPASGAPTIERTIHHRIYAKVGLSGSAPANATKATTMIAAFTTVVQQALAHGLNEIASDPGFAPAAAVQSTVPQSAAPPVGPAPAAANNQENHP